MFRVSLVALAVAAAVVPIPPHLIERAYSTTVYPTWQAWITSASNFFPVSLLDFLIVGVALAWLLLAALDVRRAKSGKWSRTVLRIAGRAVVWGAALYLFFLASWGLNYRRVRLEDSLALEHSRVAPDAARALVAYSVARLNALHEPAHRLGFGDPRSIDRELASAMTSALNEMGADRRATPARPKQTLLNLYFRRATVDGMTDPFFLETLIVSDLLPFERPSVTAHEWAHLAGYAHEGEANFVSWLTCMRGTAAHQYSGWLFLYSEAASTLPGSERRSLAASLSPGPREDLRAIVDRVTRNRSPRVQAVGWRVYNQYLKANRVESGVASYTEVVRLILGSRFSPVR
jgi:uncharacterized protein DUF3810